MDAIQLASDMLWQAIIFEGLRCGWSTTVLAWTLFGTAVLQLQQCNLWLFGSFILAFACSADEVESITLGLLWREPMTLAMLPHITLFTSHAVRAVI